MAKSIMTKSYSQPILRTRTNETLRNCRNSKYSNMDDQIISLMVEEYQKSGLRIQWNTIARKLTNHKTGSDVLHRWSTVLNPILKKGSWTPEEDLIVINWVKEKGPAKWNLLQRTFLPQRCGKQIRERWINVLSPFLKANSEKENMFNSISQKNDEPQLIIDNLKDDICPSHPTFLFPQSNPWTQDEDDLIFKLVAEKGCKWKLISTFLPGRSENSVKNRWHSLKIQKLRRLQGKDPIFKRGRKKKNETETNDRSFLMMKNNKDQLLQPLNRPLNDDVLMDDFEYFPDPGCLSSIDKSQTFPDDPSQLYSSSFINLIENDNDQFDCSLFS